MRILLIEDNIDLCTAIGFHLKQEGYTVDMCHNGQMGLFFAKQQCHNLILLDRMLPDLNGITILKTIRALHITTPVLILTALDGIGDRVEGLDEGADDYLVKPFATAELLARIRALVRRPIQLQATHILSVQDLTLDTTQKSLTGPIGSCSISKRECQLFEVFFKNPSQILTRELLLNHIWGIDGAIEEGNLDNYIFFLRKRLKTIGSSLRIITLRGIGFKLDLDI